MRDLNWYVRLQIIFLPVIKGFLSSIWCFVVYGTVRSAFVIESDIFVYPF